MFRSIAAKLAVVAAFVSVLGTSSVAEAKGFFLVTYGEDITHVADIPADVADSEGIPPGVAVGYKFGNFGLFWLNVWTWSGEYVLFEGDNYQQISEEEAALFAGHEVSKPWTYSFPPGLIVIILLVVGFLGYGMYASKQEGKVRALFEDERYKHAFDLMVPKSEDEEGGAFDDSVQYLVDQGVPKQEADENLTAMMQLVAEDAQSEEEDVSL